MKMLLLLLLTHGAATADAWSTRRSMVHYAARELNPLARPFVRSNTLYATVQIPVVVNDLLLLQTKRHRKVWRDLELGQAVAHAGATAWTNASMSEHRRIAAPPRLTSH